ncbi:sulfurtransferase [Alteromonas lipotrueiana]|uniref:sulfurtransferase n=1 Tax=Alteromonas lipotrueiana TaxID=2803815 RepID=UPI001C481D99|nr:sulfurtransferase [Alteromonas lipotrueiana]
MTDMLVSTETLADKLGQEPVVVLNAIMTMPGLTEAKSEQNSAEYLPGAQRVDLDNEGSLHFNNSVHQRLDDNTLSILLGKLGLTEHSDIVVYDNFGVFCAPRLWWMLKAVGHKKVQVLNGGLPEWRANSGITNREQPTAPSKQLYNVVSQNGWFVDTPEVVKALHTDIQIIDARSPARFAGSEPEPRKGVRSGHIPGSVNIHYQTLLRDNKFKSVDELNAIFGSQNIDLKKPVICSCGSGITACIIGMAALLCNASHVSVYDGSWTEWGSDKTLPIQMG